jgi:hypothetical protein
LDRKGEKDEMETEEGNERMVVKAETEMRGRRRDGGSRKEVETGGWRKAAGKG